MALEKIISISGQPGLYQVISQTKYGLIAENLDDSKRIPVYSNYKVSSLGDISIYTEEEDIPLNDVFLKIMEKENGKAVEVKTDAEAKAYFESVLPTYDKERVYVSDMKKLLKWYNALVKRDLIVKDEEPAEEAVEETEAAAPKKTKKAAAAAEETETVAEKKPAAKKAAAKKPAAEKKSASAAPKSAAPKAASKSKGSPKVSAPRKAQ